MTHLCVPIFVTSLEQAQRDTALAAEAGADMVEYRIDTFNDPDQLKSLLEKPTPPSIVTCRIEAEGGHCTLPEEERYKLLDIPAMQRASYIDLELQAYRRAPNVAALGGLRLILSAHDFDGRPDRLYNLLA